MTKRHQKRKQNGHSVEDEKHQQDKKKKISNRDSSFNAIKTTQGWNQGELQVENKCNDQMDDDALSNCYK
jgi:hypothetical protein